jgi:hypothetical protein
MKEKIKNTKLYLGPMSKNIVDAIIDYNTNVKNVVGIIASRRQIDFASGYVNHWHTRDFAKYIKEKNPNIIVCRDHGGIHQGRMADDGTRSLEEDARYMDIIHIDPFKKLSLDDSITYTSEIIKACNNINENCLFEVGTEEAIYPMATAALDYFLYNLKKAIPDLFPKIIYAVIQSGTSLQSGINTGEYNRPRLLTMIDVCKNYGVLSKEHNGDYLQPKQIKDKFKMGLDAINIAPEVAHIETEYILHHKPMNGELDKWFELCIKDGQYKKWFPKDFNPEENKTEVLKLCGHYVFTNPEFSDIFNLDSISDFVRKEVYKFINDRI